MLEQRLRTQKTKRCPSDIMDAEWNPISPLPPLGIVVDYTKLISVAREGINDMRYFARSSCSRFHEVAERFLSRTIYDKRLILDHVQAGRDTSVIDSQSIRQPHTTKGRKRQAINTNGCPRMTNRTTANTSRIVPELILSDPWPSASLAMSETSVCIWRL